MIDAVIDRFGLTRMPFGRDLPPGRLHRHADCAEAAARIAWAVAERTIGVVTGEVGTGKTAAVRAAVAGLEERLHRPPNPVPRPASRTLQPAPPGNSQHAMAVVARAWRA